MSIQNKGLSVQEVYFAGKPVSEHMETIKGLAETFKLMREDITALQKEADSLFMLYDGNGQAELKVFLDEFCNHLSEAGTALAGFSSTAIQYWYHYKGKEARNEQSE